MYDITYDTSNKIFYLVGNFTNSGNNEVKRVVSWNCESIQSVGGNIGDAIFAVEIYKNELYIGGRFLKNSQAKGSYISKWDGNNWVSVGEGVNGIVKDLQVLNEFYVGGDFTQSGGFNVPPSAITMIYLIFIRSIDLRI